MDKVDSADANQQPESLGPDARFWKIYREEASKFDDDMIDAWNGSLDVLLIFAGLFSAVSTSFIVEGYKNLQPDYTEYSARLLYLALSTPNQTRLSESGGPPSPNDFSASPLSKWTNGLWFISLVLSLSTALVCILAKTWLVEYRFFFFGSASEWVHHTVYRYNGLTKWHVRAIISTLPVVLHLSLFLFFAGLVLFLVDLDATIALCCGALSLLVFLLYVTSLVIPSWRPDCPYRTPLMHQIERTFKSLSELSRVVRIRVRLVERQLSEAWFTRVRIEIARPESPSTHKPGRLSQAGASRERVAVEASTASLTAEAIYWIIRDSPHFDSVSAAVQAIGSLHPLSPEALSLKRFAVMPRVINHIMAHFPDIPVDSRTSSRIRISREEYPDYLNYMMSIQVLMGGQMVTAEESNFALAMTRVEVEQFGGYGDCNGDAGLLIACGLWMHYRRNPRISYRRSILSFFSEENDKSYLLSGSQSPVVPMSPTTRAFSGGPASASRFTWEVLVHALRCFAQSDSDMKESALAFFAQSLMEFVPQVKRNLLPVSTALRSLLIDRTIRPEYVHVDELCDPVLYTLETWSTLLPALVHAVPATSLRRNIDFFVDLSLSHTATRGHAPEFLAYLASEAFREIAWTHPDLSSLHQALWALSRQATATAPETLLQLVPPALGLLRFAAERLPPDGGPMFSFAHVVELWFPPVAPSTAVGGVVARYLLAGSESESESESAWADTCAASPPSLHLAYLGDLLVRSLCAGEEGGDGDGHGSGGAVDAFFRSRFVERMVEAVYALSAAQAEDPEIMRGFAQTWLSALRSLVRLRPDRPEWADVRRAFVEHAPAQVFVHSSSYNWTTYKANSWLRDWLA